MGLEAKSSGDVWRDLMKFYSGNPSMEVIRDAWNQQRFGGLRMAQVVKNEGKKQSSGKITRNPYQSFSFRGKKTGNYITVIRFKYTIINASGGSVGPGVWVKEDIRFEDEVDNVKAHRKGDWITNQDGAVYDDYSIPFTSAKGSVRIVQPLTVGGQAKGQCETIVNANGSYKMIGETTKKEGDTMSLYENQ